jgi:hypothetical protein
MSAQPLVGGAFDDPGHAQPINVEPTKIPAFMAGPPSSAIFKLESATQNWNVQVRWSSSLMTRR